MTKNHKDMNEEEKREFEAVKWSSILAYGGKCACCGESQIEFLTIDRIDDADGRLADAQEDVTMEKVTSRQGIEYYGWLRMKRYPEGYRVLCTNCRMARIIYGYCPHGIHLVSKK